MDWDLCIAPICIGVKYQCQIGKSNDIYEKSLSNYKWVLAVQTQLPTIDCKVNSILWRRKFTEKIYESTTLIECIIFILFFGRTKKKNKFLFLFA